MIDAFKALTVFVFSAVASFLSPLWGFIFGATAVFLLNFWFGYITDLKINKVNFSLKKAKECFVDARDFFVLISAVLFVGNCIKLPEESLTAISIMLYVLLYFYSVNILKNLKQLRPKSKWIAFLYWLVAFEFLKKVPFLESYFAQNPEADPRNTNAETTEKNG